MSATSVISLEETRNELFNLVVNNRSEVTPEKYSEAIEKVNQAAKDLPRKPMDLFLIQCKYGFDFCYGKFSDITKNTESSSKTLLGQISNIFSQAFYGEENEEPEKLVPVSWLECEIIRKQLMDDENILPLKDPNTKSYFIPEVITLKIEDRNSRLSSIFN